MRAISRSSSEPVTAIIRSIDGDGKLLTTFLSTITGTTATEVVDATGLSDVWVTDVNVVAEGVFQSPIHLLAQVSIIDQGLETILIAGYVGGGRALCSNQTNNVAALMGPGEIRVQKNTLSAVPSASGHNLTDFNVTRLKMLNISIDPGSSSGDALLQVAFFARDGTGFELIGEVTGEPFSQKFNPLFLTLGIGLPIINDAGMRRIQGPLPDLILPPRTNITIIVTNLGSGGGLGINYITYTYEEWLILDYPNAVISRVTV